jgi:hypothetical protein
MKPADVCIAVLVAVIWGLLLLAKRSPAASKTVLPRIA